MSTFASRFDSYFSISFNIITIFKLRLISFSSFAKKEKKSKAAFIKRLKEEQQEYKKRETALLNKPHEVKRLSELLMLEMTVSLNTHNRGGSRISRCEGGGGIP